MEPEGLVRLSRTVEILFSLVPEEFAIEVMWAGDEASEERTVSRREMLDTFRRGRIGTRTRYRLASER